MKIRCMSCMEEYDEKFDVCPHCGYIRGTKASEPHHMEPETILHKKYIVGKVLGFGGFGVTYIGWDAVLNIKVAIKEYLPSEFATRIPGQTQVSVYDGHSRELFSSGMQSFLQEAQRLAKFNSVDGIVGIYDTFMENNTAYIVMEYLEGQTLASMIAKNGPMPVENALGIIIPVLQTLSIVNRDGIIHRDISPDNIFLTRDGAIKLLDFGSARYASAYNSKSLSVIVKRGYAPPEQYRRRGEQGPWSDNYATAATLYKMITGKTPDDSMERINRDTVVPPSAMGISINPAVENAMMNGLNLNPANRPHTAEEFIANLTGGTKRVQEQVAVDPVKFPKWLIALTASITAFAIIIGVLFGTGTVKLVSGRLIFPNAPVAEGYVRVPEILKKNKDDAEKTLKEKDLGFVITGKKEYDDKVEKNLICEQNPQAGSKIEKNKDVEAKISGGPKMGYVPDTLYYKQAVAEENIKEQGLKVKTKQEYSNNVGKGGIISQDIKEDTAVKQGEKVTVVVSKGPKEPKSGTITLSDLNGKDFETARKELLNEGVYLLIEKGEYSDTVAENIITAQAVSEGTKVNKGENVYVTISLGKEQRRVPDVQYLVKEEAVKKLENEGFVVETNVVDRNPNIADNLVINQSVESGKLIDKGSTIAIDINRAASEPVEEPVTVPEPETTTATTTTTAAPSTTTSTTTTGAKGTISGKVVNNSNGSAISGVKVQIYKNNSLVTTVTTNGSGVYTASIPAGNYVLKMSHSGYNNLNQSVTVVANKTSTATTARMLVIPPTTTKKSTSKETTTSATKIASTVSGVVTNAKNGSPLSGVSIKARKGSNVKSGNVYTSTTSASDGKYSIKLPAGNYTIEASKNGFITSYSNVTSTGAPVSLSISISENLTSGEMRIVLTWGETPSDLDSHLRFNSGGSDYHIYYSSKTATFGSSNSVKLDVDDTTSYGPETITISNPEAAEYTYYVHKFSSSGTLAESEARVTVYRGNAQIATYEIPRNATGVDWYVFKIVNGRVVTLNTFQ